MILVNSKMAPVGSTSEERSDDHLFNTRPPILTTRSIGSYLSEERSDEHKASYLIGLLSFTLQWILMTEGALRLSVAKEVGRPLNTHTIQQYYFAKLSV